MQTRFLIFTLILVLLFPIFLLADIGGENYKKGKAAYDSGNYQEAITYFEKCATEDPKNYGGKGNYMIALSYIKLGRCEKTKPYFKAAYKADPDKGGASTIEKFKAKLKACQLKVSDLATASSLKGFGTKNDTLTSTESAPIDMDSVQEVSPNTENSAALLNNNNAESKKQSSMSLLYIPILMATLFLSYFLLRRWRLNKLKNNAPPSNPNNKFSSGAGNQNSQSNYYQRSRSSRMTGASGITEGIIDHTIRAASSLGHTRSHSSRHSDFNDSSHSNQHFSDQS